MRLVLSKCVFNKVLKITYIYRIWNKDKDKNIQIPKFPLINIKMNNSTGPLGVSEMLFFSTEKKEGQNCTGHC